MKTLVAIPCMDMVHTPFFRSVIGMKCPEGEQVEISLACSSLIYDSRNLLAKKAVTNGFDRVLWLDSDMEFNGDLFLRLAEDYDNGMEYVSGLYFTRKLPVRPVVYNNIGVRDENGAPTPFADSYTDYPRDSVFQIAASGFGAVMTSCDLLRRLNEKYGLPFSPVNGFGEDLSFCLRVAELGVPMYADSRIKLGHVAFRMITEDVFTEEYGNENQ